jgi:8-oxo-dGTP pyrophosphatase MutT (NUDIX family)
MADAHEELLNVYDDEARVVGAMRRAEAKRSGRAVGAVNVLLVSAQGEVLLQRRRTDKENGGRWDKSVGGHVSAGEDFDTTAVREAGEELFDDPRSPRVKLVSDVLGSSEPTAGAVVFARAGLQRGLRDVRLRPDGTLGNVVYHVAVYLGLTELSVADLRPQASEIEGFAFFPPARVDEMLARGELAPNMAFLWLAYGRALLHLAPA